MRREQRLRRQQDFDAVFRDGRSVSSHLLALRFRRNALGHNRYGFSVSKRVGKAVTRNLVKRRLRGALTALPLVQGWDIVLVARARTATVTYDDLVRDLSHLLGRARLAAGTVTPGIG